MAGVTMPLASLSLASFFHWLVPQDSPHFLFLQYTSPDLQPPMNSSHALLSEEVRQGGRGNPKEVGAALLVWGLGAMWDIGSCSCKLRRSLGPTSNIWPVFSSTCCVLSSNLPESEPMRCLRQDFQCFKVNRIFLMI